MKLIILYRNWIYSWVMLVASLVGILSFGKIVPSWGLSFLCWVTIKECEIQTQSDHERKIP